ncbi:hypothetical protein J1N35_002280 [Gossypium stocksii]|uniref:Uncharacterized protein n=1 Tax=Gossypium stocksii TaxID=47602 RepID=A0A9D3WJC5_9ROSI|nr:hypothetical protein J1N35_002280 [Gossypium stocksii]
MRTQIQTVFSSDTDHQIDLDLRCLQKGFKYELNRLTALLIMSTTAESHLQLTDLLLEELSEQRHRVESGNLASG